MGHHKESDQVFDEIRQKIFLATEEKVNKLKELPSHGRIVPELETQNINDYRELIEWNYRII